MDTSDANSKDWSKEKGIANEAMFNALVERLGGNRVDKIYPNPTFQNADYFFERQRIVIELKILEKEFGTASEYRERAAAILQKHAQQHAFQPLTDDRLPERLVLELIEIFRRPIAAVVRKANRQIRETKQALGFPDAPGILLCVNDNFRALRTDVVMHLLCRVLMGAYSSISAVVYATNHHVHVPGNNYANLIWSPAYSESAPDSLVEFINTMGREWGNLCEEKLGKFDSRIETDDNSILGGARPI